MNIIKLLVYIAPFKAAIEAIIHSHTPHTQWWWWLYSWARLIEAEQPICTKCPTTNQHSYEANRVQRLAQRHTDRLGLRRTGTASLSVIELHALPPEAQSLRQPRGEKTQ